MKPIELSIIVPTYNEERTISQVVAKIRNTQFLPRYEIIVVDDGSTDATFDICKNIPGIQLIRYERNIGKGFAIRQGLRVAKWSIIAIQDADHEYNPKDLGRLINFVRKKEADVAYGSRALGRKNVYSYFLYALGSKIITGLFNIIHGTDLTDPLTCYKVFPHNVAKDALLTSNGFAIEAELTSLFVKKKLKIVEVPVEYSPRKKHEGKKIRLRHGIAIVGTIIRRIWQDAYKEQFLERLLRAMRIRRVKRLIGQDCTICDVGCGKHYNLLQEVRSKIVKGFGVDKEVIVTKEKNIECIPIDVESKLPFPDKMFDVVTMLATIEHLNSPSSVLRECKRILKKNGKIIITTPPPSSKKILELLAFRFGLISAEQILEHKHYFTRDELRQMLHTAGFKSIRMHKFQFGLNILAVALK